MNCKQARGKLALLIGNDLDVSAIAEVQKHVSQCAGCRERLQRLSSCLEVLQVPAAGTFLGDGESLWPRISVRLASPTAGQKPHRLSGWAPTLAVAAACTAMYWVASYQFVGDTVPSGVSLPGAPIQPINGSAERQYDRFDHPYPMRAQPINDQAEPPRQHGEASGTMRWID
jgi:hypothetical protein